jgi:hypothetical protein
MQAARWVFLLYLNVSARRWQLVWALQAGIPGQALNAEISQGWTGIFPVVGGPPGCENVGMIYPRSHLVFEDEPGFNPVVPRCVRRTFPVGKGQPTLRCFKHRQDRIETWKKGRNWSSETETRKPETGRNPRGV